MRRQRPDLRLVAGDGVGVAGHISLLCLHSPALARILAGHDQAEAITTVSIPATSAAVRAFNRYLLAGFSVHHVHAACPNKY
jgi:hypothetical protein